MQIDELPRFCAINGLPVKFVATAEGGMDVLAWDFQTKEFARHLEYIDYLFNPGGDIEELTEAEFNALVETMRATAGTRR